MIEILYDSLVESYGAPVVLGILALIALVLLWGILRLFRRKLPVARRDFPTKEEGETSQKSSPTPQAPGKPAPQASNPEPAASAPPAAESAPRRQRTMDRPEGAAGNADTFGPPEAASDIAEETVGAELEDHYIVTVHYGTDRADAGASSPPKSRFTADRAPALPGTSPITTGTCEVSIPKSHKVGELEAPGWFETANPGRHVLLLSARTKDTAAFFTDLTAAMGAPKQAFIFVHGFSVSFEDAARRTAQMAFDMRFQGAPIFYSWPTEVFGLTNPDLTAYSESESNARWATAHFRAFLQDVVQRTGAETVHLIAHSMGNRIVTDALMELFWVLNDAEKATLGEIVLTAPDIDAAVFVEQIAPRITKMNNAVTLYTSTKDQALSTSKRIHGHPRIGDFNAVHDLPILPADVDVIDAK